MFGFSFGHSLLCGAPWLIVNQPKKNSVVADAKKLIALRHALGWTQEQAARRVDYSDRLIRKLELGSSVRPKTLFDILACYHDHLAVPKWELNDFLESGSVSQRDTAIGEARIARVKEYYEVVYNQRDIENAPLLFSEDVVFTGEGVTRRGREILLNRAKTFLAAFCPIEFRVVESFAQNDLVVSYWNVRMRHSGEFFEVPATDLWVEVRGNSIIRFEEEWVVEAEDQWDVEDLFRQLRGESPRVI